MDKKQNERIASITKDTLVIGCDIGSSIHYGRAFNFRGIIYLYGNAAGLGNTGILLPDEGSTSSAHQ